jgi:hypothetical protein
VFEQTRKLLEQYLYLIENEAYSTKLAIHQLQEVRARLRQLEACYEAIQSGVNAILPEPAEVREGRTTNHFHVFTETGAAEPDPTRIATLPPQQHDNVVMLVEYFYYASHRVIDIVNDGLRHLPGLIRIRADGITTVRNHLIEHVRHKGGNTVYSFSLSVSGPRLRPISWSKDPPASRDEGLWANAHEFESILRHSLEAGIAYHEA